jgi:16S rRNA (guanine527-N7)-methyltransferase
MTPEAFRRATGVSRETLSRLENYAEILKHWQSRVNLVGAATLPDLWRRHMYDSAQLAAHLPPSARIITDIGAGAGFPGLVLAIMLGLETHLIEANKRKCAFLREAARATGTTVQIHPKRAQSLTPWASDVITARAVLPLSDLLALAQPFMAAGGAAGADSDPVCLFLKGRGVEEELTESQKKWNMQTERFASESGDGTILRIRGLSRE